MNQISNALKELNPVTSAMNDISKSVDEYIKDAPREVQPKLKQMRSAIRKAAPDAVESISYGMPFYNFKEETGFKARLCYFGLLKSKNKIVFYTRPTYLEEYKDEVKTFLSAKSALQFPLDEPIPIQLIKKIVRNGIRKHKSEDTTSRAKQAK